MNIDFSNIKWNDDLYNEYIEYLFSNADEKYKEFIGKLTPNEEFLIGIRSPEMKKIAKEIYSGSWMEFLDIAMNRKTHFQEEIMIIGFVIGNIKDKDTEFKNIEQYIDKFTDYIRNWAINDRFCSCLKITKKHKAEMMNIIEKNLKSEKLWNMRFAVVMLMNYYIDDDYIDFIFDVCEEYRLDEYYYKMSVAWLISMCFVKLREKTLLYLKENTLDDFTYNKAIQKIRESKRVSENDKIMLNEMKRK